MSETKEQIITEEPKPEPALEELQSDKIEKEKQRQQEAEKERKRQQKRMKKEKKKQKKLEALRELDTSREYSEEEYERKTKESKIWQNVCIPEELKPKFVECELNKVKVCVGNIPFNIQDRELKEFIETVIITLKPSMSIKPPIQKIEIGDTKNYAIITCIDREARNLMLKCDNLEYQGYKLQIQKPRGFFEQIYDSAKAHDPFENIKMGVQEGEYQLYMGNIPTYLKDTEVKKICESFGILKFFKMVMNKNDEGQWVSKGYCFFEYQDPKVTELALQGLDGLELGKNQVRVKRAQTESAMDNVAEQHEKQASNAVGGSYLATYHGIVNPTIQKMLDIPLCAVTPSKVVQFLNMASADDLVDDEFYEILMEDIYSECSIYGNIETVEIPRPDLVTGKVGPNVGKVFVKFDYLIPAKKCRHHINGRIYNKRTVIGSFYPEDRFNKKEYLLKL